MRTGMGVNCTKPHYQQKNPQNPYGDSGFIACYTFRSTGQVQIHMGQCCYVALPVVFLLRGIGNGPFSYVFPGCFNQSDGRGSRGQKIPSLGSSVCNSDYPYIYQ